MLLIELKPNQNVTHNDHSTPDWATVPEGWGKVPQELESLAMDLLPFVVLTVKDGIITSISDNAEARAAWEALPKPTPEPTPEEDRDAMLIDQEYRLTLLELGVN